MTLAFPFVLATQNPGKAREIVEIFVALSGVALIAYSIDGIAFLVDTPERIAAAVAALPALTEAPDVEETGATLEENARIKAKALAGAFGLLALADDSGLAVDALAGAPGVHSARYAGAQASDADNVAKLLRELGGVDTAAARHASPRWPWRVLPTVGRWWPGARSKVSSAPRRADTAGSGTTRCSSRPRVTGGRLRR